MVASRRTLPGASPAWASRFSSNRSTFSTSSGCSILGTIRPCKPGRTTACRSASIPACLGPWARTKRVGPAGDLPSAVPTALRARSTSVGGTPSSRSNIKTSAFRPTALSIIFCLWPGTNNQDRLVTMSPDSLYRTVRFSLVLPTLASHPLYLHINKSKRHRRGSLQIFDSGAECLGRTSDCRGSFSADQLRAGPRWTGPGRIPPHLGQSGWTAAGRGCSTLLDFGKTIS